MVAATGDDQLLGVVVPNHKLPLADMLGVSLGGPHLVAERVFSRRRRLLLSFLVLVDANRVQAGLELARRLVMGEVTVGPDAIGSIAAHRHSRTRDPSSAKPHATNHSRGGGGVTYCLKGHTGLVQLGKYLQSCSICLGRR